MPFTEEHKLFFDVLFAEASKGKNSKDDITAIANVIKNRASKPQRFGEGIAGVILAPSQFSGVGSPEFQKAQTQKFTLEEENIYKDIVQIGSGVLSGAIADPTNGADHYFNPKLVRPSWAKKMKKVYDSGSHVFYRE